MAIKMRKIFPREILSFLFILCAFCNVSLVLFMNELTSGLKIESTEGHIAKYTQNERLAGLGINLWTFRLSTARPHVALCDTARCGLTITSHLMRC